MAEKQHLLSKVRKEFEKNPVTSNVVFSFILYCLEKLLEWEFVCPCNPELNVQLAVAFFFVPAFLVFLLMIIIQGCTCKNVCLSFIPAIVWLILVFLDGKYFACWKTSWSGKYETVSGSSHLKWCKPADQNPPKEFLETTQYWFSVSQSIGIWSVILLAIPSGCAICQQCNKQKKDQGSSTPQNMEASSVSVNIKDQGYSVCIELQPRSQ